MDWPPFMVPKVSLSPKSASCSQHAQLMTACVAKNSDSQYQEGVSHVTWAPEQGQSAHSGWRAAPWVFRKDVPSLSLRTLAEPTAATQPP